MKAKYILNPMSEVTRVVIDFDLTDGKIYDVTPTENGMISFFDDKGLFIKNMYMRVGETVWFIDVTQEEREKTIDKILDI